MCILMCFFKLIKVHLLVNELYIIPYIHRLLHMTLL